MQPQKSGKGGDVRENRENKENNVENQYGDNLTPGIFQTS
jgi:hypothetical protein